MDYKDKFTLDGLVEVPRGVTVETVGKVAGFIAEARRGSRVAEAQLLEGLTSGDLATATAHLMNLISIPQLPEVKDRPISALAGSRVVPDFRPAVLTSIFGDLTGAGIDASGSAAVIPEGQPYPEVTISGVESAYAKLQKRGVRFNWTFEAMINDVMGILDGIPGELRDLALDTEWNEIGEALLKATTKSGSVTLPDGTVVPEDSPVSPNAIWAATIALGERKVNGRKIGSLSGYNVVVPVGRKVFVEYQIRQAMNIVSIVPGSSGGVVYGAPDMSIFSTISVIEHPAVTGTNWYLLPKPGAYRRPVLDILRLRGYETPQIRVRNDGGDSYSFDADTAAFRLRMVVGAALWDQTPVVYSDGTP